MPTEEELRYPIGRFQFIQSTPDLRAKYIHQFRLAPGILYDAVKDLTENQLLSTYRSDGWTLAQVVHHLVESDVNAYPRLKYALTQDVPDVMIAQQELWAELPDSQSPNISFFSYFFRGNPKRLGRPSQQLTKESLT